MYSHEYCTGTGKSKLLAYYGYCTFATVPLTNSMAMMNVASPGSLC